MIHLRRAVTGANIPMPRALLKLVLSLLVPRLLQRAILGSLLPELGKYLLEADQSIHLAGAPSVLVVLSCTVYTLCALCLSSVLPELGKHLLEAVQSSFTWLVRPVLCCVSPACATDWCQSVSLARSAAVERACLCVAPLAPVLAFAAAACLRGIPLHLHLAERPPVTSNLHTMRLSRLRDVQASCPCWDHH